jgi:putative aldouronate transport system substrate-binding protein
MEDGMKIFYLACVLWVLGISHLAAGGGQQGGSSKPSGNSADIVTPAGQIPIVKQPISLTIGIQQSSNVADYNTNYLTKFLNEKTGIDLKFQLFASAANDANTQFELMVSSNEKLPDIMINSGFPDWMTYGDNGVFVDLTPYFEKYAYFFNQRMEKLSPAEQNRIRIAGTSSSGKRYAWIMYSEQSTQNYRSMNFINQKWLEKLGLKMPATTDEFYNTLVAFRDRDPNGNGQKDEIPFIGGLVYAGEPLAFLINAFVYYPYRDANNGFLNATNGKLWTPWTTEEYREALRYINKLYRENLIAPSTFTITQNELTALLSYEKNGTNKVGFFSAHQNQTLRPETPAIFDYTFQVSLTGPKGVNWYPQLPSRAIPTSFITKDCAYPEAAFRFLDFITEKETTMIARYGEKDVDWRWTRPEEKAINYLNTPAFFEQINMIWGVPQNKHWSSEFAQIYIESENGFAAWKDDGSWIASRYKMYQKIFINDGKDAPEKVDKIIYTREEEDSIREIRTTINSYREECLALFCTGAMNLDRDWNTYLAELDKMGLKRYLDVAQKAYSRTVGK